MLEPKQLSVTAAKARLLGLDMVYRAASGHLGGSFSSMDLLTLLYHNVLRVDPKNLSLRKCCARNQPKKNK